MAKADDQDKAPGGKGKLIIILAVVLVLLAGGGGAAWWFLLRPKPEQSAAHAAQAKAEAELKNIHFISLEQFVTNVQSQDGETHYVQVNVDLKTADPKADEAVKAVMPEIRSAVLNTLGAQQATTITNPAVQQQLSAALLKQINAILASGPEATPDMIRGVYFTGFILQ